MSSLVKGEDALQIDDLGVTFATDGKSTRSTPVCGSSAVAVTRNAPPAAPGR